MAKDKGIDLGALQAEFEEAKKDAIAKQKAYLRANDENNAARARLNKASEALQEAMKAVLN